MHFFSHLRPLLLIASALSLRYEFRKPWRVNPWCMALEIPLTVYRKVLDESGSGEMDATTIISMAVAELPKYAAHVACTAGLCFFLEERDRKQFMRTITNQAGQTAHARPMIFDAVFSLRLPTRRRDARR